MTTLTCEHNGHSWERPPQRGRRPRYCPEHTGRPTPDATLAPKWRALAADYQALLAALDGDSHRILRYIIGGVLDPARADTDKQFLIETGRLHGVIPRETKDEYVT